MPAKTGLFGFKKEAIRFKIYMLQYSSLNGDNKNMNYIYSFTISLFIKNLNALKHILEKSEEYAREKNIDPNSWLDERLAPDMFPLVKQIQVVCDNAKGAAARLAEVEIPKYEDNEKTFAELKARIDKTIEFLETFSEESFKNAADAKVALSYFPGKYMTGQDYACEYAVPNFLFHMVAAYAILRKNGVPLGKADFINGLPLKDVS